MSISRGDFKPGALRFLRKFDAWVQGLENAPDPDILRGSLRPGEARKKAGRHSALLARVARSFRSKLDASQDWNLLAPATAARMRDASIYYILTGKRSALRPALEALRLMEKCKRKHFCYSTLIGLVDVDLRTAAVTKSLAYMYAAFGPMLDARLKRRVRKIALERCLQPALQALRADKYWWTQGLNNWRSVMTGSFAVGAMAFSDVFKPWAEMVEYGIAGLLTIMELGDRAGGWNEGASYWEYGIVHCAEPAFFLKAFSGGKVDLLKHRFLGNTCDFRTYMTVRPGRVWNWSDCHKQVEPSICATILARTGQKPAWQHLAKAQGIRSLQQLYFLDADLPAEQGKDLALSKLFPDLGVAVMRTGFETRDEFVGFKAGTVGTDVGHCHLDLGSVTIFAQGRELLAETDYWPYAQHATKARAGGFFDSAPNGRRWNFDGNAGVGHNLPVIGDGYPRRETRGRARIAVHDFGANHDLLMADLTPFYRPLATRVRRYMAYLRPGVVVLVDELRAREKIKPRVLYHFLKSVKTGPDSFTITNGSAQLACRSLCPSPTHNIVLGQDQRLSTYNTERGQMQVENKFIYYENLHRAKRQVFVSVMAFGKRPVTPPKAELIGDPDLEDRFSVEVKRGRRKTTLKLDLRKGSLTCHG